MLFSEMDFSPTGLGNLMSMRRSLATPLPHHLIQGTAACAVVPGMLASGALYALDGKLPLRATAEIIHRGDFQQRVFNSPFVDQVDSYTVVNLTTSLEISDTAGVDFMILNASDEDGVNSAMTDVFGVAGTGIELIPPRQFILRVRKSY